MSGTKSPHGGLTRRSFLKTTGAIAGAATIGGGATMGLSALAEDYEAGQPQNADEQVFCGVCVATARANAR